MLKLLNLDCDTPCRSSFALQTLPLPHQILVTIPTNALDKPCASEPFETVCYVE